LFPVAGPIPHIGSLYSVPLEGYIWTWLGEAIRHNAHYIGGTIPSPHAAAATIMWIMAYRYHRPSFWILSPIVLSLYVSTFYGRYHYVTDAIIGIIVAFIGLAFAPILMNLWNRIVKRCTVISN
jgi:membrane-associated phospholipid phosphatase